MQILQDSLHLLPSDDSLKATFFELSREIRKMPTVQLSYYTQRFYNNPLGESLAEDEDLKSPPDFRSHIGIATPSPITS